MNSSQGEGRCIYTTRDLIERSQESNEVVHTGSFHELIIVSGNVMHRIQLQGLHYVQYRSFAIAVHEKFVDVVCLVRRISAVESQVSQQLTKDVLHVRLMLRGANQGIDLPQEHSASD